MIQIQDDAVQASVNPNNAPSMPTSAYVPPATPSDSSSAASMSNSAPAKDNSAEIDRLLAELDKLSKELDSQAAPEKATSAPVATDSTPVVAQPAVSASAPSMSAPAPSVSTPAPEQKSADKAEEKFDFDAFLADLEKKIDAEAAKSQAVPAADSVVSSSPTAPVVSPSPAAATPAPADEEMGAADFRKNRSTPDLVTDETALPAEPEAEAKPAEPEEKVSEEKIVNPPSVDEAAAAATDSVDQSEDLKSQNIFDMLGLSAISDEEKNQFLDELEMMIWDDFVMHDLELLLTSEEYAQARQILDDQVKSEDERKEALIIFLEKLIPDLDEVLYEKALELKSEMMGERLAKLKENTDQSVVDKVKQAESMISENRWRSAADLLNSL